MAFSDVIARLAVSLSLDTAAFQTGSRKAQRETETLRGKMTTAAKAIGTAMAGMVSWEVVQQLRDWTQAAVDAVGGLGEQAAALGVTSDALQEYRYAATQVGLSAAEMDKGLEQLTRRLGDAQLGVKEPTEALERLGITLDEIQGKTAGELIPMIADGMAKIEDPTQRAAIAVDLFGRAGQKLSTLLAGGAEGVNNLRQAAHDLGIVLSESDIAKADEVADKVAALRYVLEAQQNAKLLENAESLLAYEQAVADLKIGLIDASGTLQQWVDEFDAFNARNIDAMAGFRDATHLSLDEIKAAWAAFRTFVVDTVGGMVAGIRNWLGNQLDAVWKRVTDKIAVVKAAFFGLYDAVVGRSYIPDMVDGIAAEMARLDTVMVDPARRAARNTAAAFREAAAETRALFDRLFPEIGAADAFRREGELIGKSGLTDEQKRAAMLRSSNLFATGNPFGTSDRPEFGDTSLYSPEATQRAIEDFVEVQDRLARKAHETSVRVAKSFRDMVQESMAALSKLTTAIKSGGFLDILDAAVGVGLQLGSMGAFGKSFAGKVNATVPGYAGGTSFHPGGLAMVGERGPELVSMPRGSRVYSNDNSRGMMGGVTVHVHANDAVLAETVRGWVAEGVGIAIKGGAAAGEARMLRRADRSLG